MNILGLDFTSKPTARKPIVAATGTLQGDQLHLDQQIRMQDFEAFDTLLEEFEGVGGYDFPFGLPTDGIAHFTWGDTWAEIIGAVDRMPDLNAFVQTIKSAPRRAFRPSDRFARSASPMNAVYPPVARMFYQGAPRLYKTPISVHPCRPSEGSKHIALEVYPALAARCIIGRRPYKSDEKKKQQERLPARTHLVNNLETLARIFYNLRLTVDAELRAECLTDASGDTLDAVLAAIITGWAARTPNYGIPHHADPREGWIVDPLTLHAAYPPKEE
jgi:hypothetical protein